MEEELLSVAQAANRYGLSESHLVRRLRAGGIPGARKVSGKRGPEWRVTPAGMEADGWTEASDISEAQADERTEDPLAVIRSLTRVIEDERKQHTRVLARYADLLATSAAAEAELKTRLKAERDRRMHAEEQVKRLTDRVGRPMPSDIAVDIDLEGRTQAVADESG